MNSKPEPTLDRLTVGSGDGAREIAVRLRSGGAPGIFWLGGFRSDMDGTKAAVLDNWAAEQGSACTRFDYSGHGRSGGRFEDGTISRWLEEACAVFQSFTAGPVVAVGSSMGGWMALLLAKALREAGESGRLAGMVLIAPAVDMTRDLMWDRYDPDARRQITEQGIWHQPSDYSDEPYPITRVLIEDGERHLLGDGPIETGCPVHIIQGMRDTDVPWRHATRLVERLAHDDAVLTLVRDGDHRLSRPEDLERLKQAVAAVSAT